MTAAIAPVAPAATPAGLSSAARPPQPRLLGVLGALLSGGVWVVAAAWRPDLFPSPWAVIRSVVDDWSIIRSNGAATLAVAVRGWLIGNALALALATVVAAIPALEQGVVRTAAMAYCLPALAIGPILQVLLTGDNPKIALSALGVLFTTLVGAVVGLRAAPRSATDVVRAAGGGRWKELRIARLRAALPALLSSMRIAGPAAVLGAILGEYLGGAKGLGPAMITAQTQMNVPRTWALGAAATALAGLAYALPGVLLRVLCPWATTANAEAAAVSEGATVRRGLTGGLRALASIVATILGAVLVWWAAIVAFGLDPLVAKTPADVWGYLVSNPQAAAHRSDIVGAMSTTLRTAGVGYVAGTVAALVLVAAFIRWRALEYAAMPAAVVLQSVPLSVFTPIFLIVFGRGVMTSAWICGIVVFFPTLVMTLAAARNVPTAILDVFDVSGAGPWHKLLRAQLPAAMPALLAAGRVAVPRAVIGALLVEWLATGDGIGYLMLRSTTMFEFTRLWAAVAVCTLTMLLLYALLSALESIVLGRLAGTR